MSIEEVPGQAEIDQINLEAHWGNILRSLRGVKGKRFDVSALLRGTTPRIAPPGQESDGGSCLNFETDAVSKAERIVEALQDNEVVKAKIKDALLVATGRQFAHLAVTCPQEEVPEDLPW